MVTVKARNSFTSSIICTQKSYGPKKLSSTQQKVAKACHFSLILPDLLSGWEYAEVANWGVVETLFALALIFFLFKGGEAVRVCTVAAIEALVVPGADWVVVGGEAIEEVVGLVAIKVVIVLSNLTFRNDSIVWIRCKFDLIWGKVIRFKFDKK